MAEEGEEAQGVHGLLSPGWKVSETPTDVKAMEVVASREACKESVKTVVSSWHPLACAVHEG